MRRQDVGSTGTNPASFDCPCFVTADSRMMATSLSAINSLDVSAVSQHRTRDVPGQRLSASFKQSLTAKLAIYMRHLGTPNEWPRVLSVLYVMQNRSRASEIGDARECCKVCASPQTRSLACIVRVSVDAAAQL